MIYVEDLQVENMSKSAKGTAEKHGQKREIEIKFEPSDIRPILVWVQTAIGLQIT